MFLLLAVACALVSADLAANPGAPADSFADLDPIKARFTPANEQGRFRYLVEFARPGLLRAVSSGQAGRASEYAGQRLDSPFDPNSPEVQAERAALQTYQARQRQAIAATLGRVPTVSHHFLAANNGLALWLTPEEAEAIARLPQVASIEREREYELATSRGPWFIGADTIWSGFSTPDGIGRRGEDMVLGLLDSGIDPAHPSFANDPACGHGQGGVPAKVLSALDCSATDEDGLCAGPDPVDDNGHGSHVGGTAVGNRLGGSALPPPEPPGPGDEISGVAPCAHIRSYRTCPGATCPGANLLAGMDSVLLHGDVDVMNFSISGGTSPWNDGDRVKLDLVEAGVLVAAAAGNTSAGSPSPVGQVNHRGPWVLSVAASTHDGVGSSGLLSVSGPGAPPETVRNLTALQGVESPAAPELLDFPILHFDNQPPAWEGCTPGEDDNGDGNIAPPDMEPFPEGFFAGAAALILRGGCFLNTKISNARDAGAELVIIRNNQSGTLLMVGQPGTPAYSMQQAPGNALQDFVDAHPATASIDFEPIAGDVLADFSMRGPTPAPLENLTKPDLTAPGVLIYAALPEDIVPEGYGFLNGTSMASPHAAGAALLLRQTHPDWTVSEVMSALMTTAKNPGRKESLVDAWDPDDVGSGRVDLTRAARAGLVFDETAANYLAADPAEGGDVRGLNTPSLRDMNCLGICSFTRTVRNTLDVPARWQAVGRPHAADDLGETPAFEITIEPETFEFNGDPGETRELTITVHPLENNLIAPINFGEVVFAESGAQAPDQHLTVAVRGRPPQPVVDVDPSSLAVESGAAPTRTVTLTNLGELSLEWAVTEEFTPSSTGGPVDCNNQPGLIIQDTGALDNALGADPGSSDEVMIVDRFTPEILPAEITDVCLAFVNQAGPSSEIEFEIVVLDDDGPDGAPGTELGAMPATAGGFPADVGTPVWRSFDISALEIVVESGGVYIGARWAPQNPNFWLGVDFSAAHPPGFAGGWWWVGPQDAMFPLQEVWSDYRAMFIRPLAEIGALDCTLPGWAGVDASAGTIGAGNARAIEIAFDAAGLAFGVHSATLCLQTNDPDRPLVVVPLEFTVSDLVFSNSFETGGAP